MFGTKKVGKIYVHIHPDGRKTLELELEVEPEIFEAAKRVSFEIVVDNPQ